jgi:hypothetical protein
MSGDQRLTKKLMHNDDEAAALLRYLKDHGGRGGADSEEPIVPEKLPIFVGWISAPDAQIHKPSPL